MRFLGGMIVGSLAGRHAARRQFEAMQAAQAQQEQIKNAQAQAVEAKQTSNHSKGNLIQELERLATLKQQGILTEEEFQKFKTKLLSDT
jgi:multidrug resistance efflux pump